MYLHFSSKKTIMLYEDLTYAIRVAIFNVHKEIGSGLLEKVYEAALCHELKLLGLKSKCQVPIDFKYKDVDLKNWFFDKLQLKNAC